ncbi:uncharacterized protein LOC120632137 [Pararge aegeria]|uniref:uncharacterized protein LOC120632137 n=1 Tax=Pararge aegeria TaxID=116150 RepID=UPI0019D2DF8E|nr:uncharacterized protein LOC120632137 [Pararge aegeria]
MYASSVWAPATQKLMTQKQLNTVQRSFAQKICKSYRTVSLNAALILAGLIPLDLRIQEASQLFEAKRGRPQPTLKGRKMEKRVSFLNAPHPSEEVEVKFQCLEDLEPETVAKHAITGFRIFTDGSKMNGGVGAALSCWEAGEEIMSKKFRLEAFCTVFQAEMYALYQATEVALKTNRNTVNILSDSRSALEALGSTKNSHPLVFTIRRNLSLLRETQTITHLFWIRAHVGVDGNERADFLAREAVTKLKTKSSYDRCPISFIKRTIRQSILDEWGKRYKNGETAAVTKIFLPSVEQANKILKKITLSPLLTQVFTGHGGFSEYLHRFKCKDDPGCVCDENVDETIFHLLIDCPQHSRALEDLHQQIHINLCKNSIPVILNNASARDPFLNYCVKVARVAIERNRTQ